MAIAVICSLLSAPASGHEGRAMVCGGRIVPTSHDTELPIAGGDASAVAPVMTYVCQQCGVLRIAPT